MRETKGVAAGRPAENETMLEPTLHRALRRALEEADELGRRAHEAGRGPLSHAFEGLRTTLHKLDEAAIGGGASAVDVRLAELSSVLVRIDGLVAESPALRAAHARALDGFRALHARLRAEVSPGLGARHGSRGAAPGAAVDFAFAGLFLSSLVAAATPRARAASAALAASSIFLGVLGVRSDALQGAMAIAAPFALKYAGHDPRSAAVHVGAGVGRVLVALARR
jgi:hypothetical protein